MADNRNCQSVNDTNLMTLNLLLANIKFLTTNTVFEFSVLSGFLHPFKILCLGFQEKGIFACGGVRCSQPSRQKNTQHSPANSPSATQDSNNCP